MISTIVMDSSRQLSPGGSWLLRSGLSAGVIALLVATGAVCTPAWAGVYRVNAASTAATPDGASWETAFRDIQSAVEVASAAGGEVWVAAGTYTAATDPVVTMKEDVHLYGGFAGTESTREERDWANQEAVIDGENSRRCVNGASNGTLDGFFVTRGKSISGGGMYNAGASSPTVANCTFTQNTADDGAGMYNFQASPAVSNCIFTLNTAHCVGGGMYNDESSLTVTNCTFAHNAAYGEAQKKDKASSLPAVMQGAFAAKSLSCRGGGMSNHNSSLTVTNCILWGDQGGEIRGETVTVSYSCIEGGYLGEENIDANPLFWNVLAGDVRLHSSSPCTDSGTATGAPSADIRGVARPQGAGVDRGAYEMNELDTDGDGLMDDFETTYSDTDPNDADSDDDGVSDGDVWLSFRVWRVDAASAASSPDGLTWGTAFPDIQAAVNGAYTAGGGEIWVADGTYTGAAADVVVMRYDVHLYGGFSGAESTREERDWTNYETVINGEHTRRCVLGANNATLDGFRVTLGVSINGGGMYNFSSSPTVTNCAFTDNEAEGPYGGGTGGGMYNDSSSPTVTNCTFTNNGAEYEGGAMYNSGSSPTVMNCTFAHNEAESGGGGMYNISSSPTVVNCTFAANETLGDGGAMHNYNSSSPVVIDCTFTANVAEQEGGGMYNYDSSSSPTVTNCILWGDTAGEISGGTPTVTYSCVEGGYTGEGNLDANPLFWNAPEGDFRLHASSPCVDSGTSIDAPSADIRGVARPQGAGVDRGAYEMNEPDTDGDGLMDEFETTYSHTDPDDADSDDDGVNDWDAWFGSQVWYVDAASTAATPDGLSWGTAFPDIQSAVDSAHVWGGGEIWVAAGTYTGAGDNVVEMRYNVHLYGGFAGTESGREERDWANQETVIDGEDSRRCVVGANDATLDGFTVTRGMDSRSGGGMYNTSSSPTVTNCTFTQNAAESGGGMYNSFSSPAVTSCTFADNTASREGGGMCNDSSSSPTVTNCTFTANSAIPLYPYSSECYGGGMYNSSSSPTVTNCAFVQNTAQSGGEIFNSSSSPAVTNCTFYGTGGMYNRSSSSPTVTNCILWGRRAGEISGGTPTVTYSCIEGGYEGEGNTDADPLFWNAPNGDFRLHPSSPCMDTGTSTGAPSADIRGVARPQGAGVDRGACEMDEPDTDGDGLMDEFETTYSHTDPDDADSDDDGVNDWDAWFSFRVWRVDAASMAAVPDGLSWATAFPDVQSAVDSAYVRNGGEIWVAAGTYTGDGDNVVVLQDNVHLYGGFAGTESAREERDWEHHETVIDGEDERRCIFGADDSTLNGFTVTRGRSMYGGGMYNVSCSPTVTNCMFAHNEAYNNDAQKYGPSSSPTTGDYAPTANKDFAYGGGIYNSSASPTVTDCTFTENTAYEGGGMGNVSSSPTVTHCTFSANTAHYDGGGMCNASSSPTVTNCTFSQNTATYSGGGMSSFSSSPTVTNCTFTQNTVDYPWGLGDSSSLPAVTDYASNANKDLGDGGGMYNDSSSSSSVTNCVFTENTASSYGGGMYGDSPSLAVTNCTFTANTAGDAGGGMYNGSSSPTVTNCILWGDTAGEILGGTPTVTYSCVEGGYTGEGNTDADPLLGPLGDWGGHVQTCPIGGLSSARDTGVRCFLDTDGTFFHEIPGGGGYATSDGTAYVPASVENEQTTTDARGVLRPQGLRVDMGAYELADDDLHAADTDGDGTVSATEIGRVVGFYNAGGYHVDGSTLDGYAPGAGSQEGAPHDSDYSPQDWTIAAIELGRLVAFYNAGGYVRDSGTADGFAPAVKGE